MAHNNNTLGNRLLADLTCRKMTGFIFSFKQRCELRQIDSREELLSWLESIGLHNVDVLGTESEIIDAIGTANTPRTGWLFAAAFLDVIFFGIPTIVTAVIEAVRRKKH